MKNCKKHCFQAVSELKLFISDLFCTFVKRYFDRGIPHFIKIIFSLFMLVLIPIYWIHYGPQNFLWVCDVTLMIAFLATILESQFLASMAAAGGLLYSVVWDLDFLWLIFSRLFTSSKTSFITNYMFDPGVPLWLRFFSFFHFILPFFLIYLIYRLGYNRRAWLVQFGVLACLIIVTWLITTPVHNVNFVYGYKLVKSLNMSAFSFLSLEISVFFLVVLSTHLILRAFR